jgi:opacity protein-like surface antigen
VSGRSILAAVVFMIATASGTVDAQSNAAVTLEDAPVYLLPDVTRTPLRILARSTPLRVLRDDGDWLQVEFQDRQFGARIGYIEKKKVRIIREPVASVTPPSTEPARQPQPPEKPGRPQAAPVRSSGLGARAYGTFGGTRFAASDTFDAIGSNSTLGYFGGGGTIAGFWRGLFVDMGYSQTKTDGERVFVDEGVVYPLGIDLDIRVRCIDLAGGWRFKQGRLSPYVGGGLTLTSYKETSAFSEAGDDISEQKPGPMVLAGVDAQVIKWMHIGAELRYRAVSGILGDAGASEAFGEDDAGGFAVGVRVSFGR